MSETPIERIDLAASRARDRVRAFVQIDRLNHPPTIDAKTTWLLNSLDTELSTIISECRKAVRVAVDMDSETGLGTFKDPIGGARRGGVGAD